MLAGVFMVSGCSGPKPITVTEPVVTDTIHSYLQIAGTDDNVVVIWTTELPEPSKVTYGSAGGSMNLLAEDPLPVINHFLPLKNLDPDTSYDYQVVAGKSQSAVNTFQTLPATKSDGTSEPFTMIAYGDNRSNPDLHERVIDQIVFDGIPSLVISSGDLVYSGRDSIRWFREFLMPADRLFSQAPIMLSLGNHDVDWEKSKPNNLAQWWLDRFAFPGQGTDVGYGRWFSYEAGGIHLIHLDSTVPENQDQLAWLEADLRSPESQKADFRIAVFHHPPYSSGGHGSNKNVREAWEPLLEKYEVAMAFNGHNHFYQRTLPVFGGEVSVQESGTKNGVDFIHSEGLGVVYIITGGGGAPLYEPKPSDFVALNVKERHFIKLEYVPGEIHCTVINEDGTVIDEFIVGH